MKIICIGRNYVAHIQELNNEVPDEPVFFMKPDSSLLRNNDPFFIPEWTSDVHHEVELVLRVGKLGKGIEKRFAHRYYDAIGLGIDFTARDVQNKLKAKGLPWEKAKAFDRAAVIGSVFLPVESFEDLKNIGFRLDINGNTVQDGNSGLMIYDFDTIISYVSSFVTLKIGDLIYTGTPVGVGPVHSGDVLAGYLEAQEMFRFKVK
jgi:2-keto-4-pentenoate hydratase/2-oxohepta-3-ene-1,7-dioic acid hydratase in catechol pathway